MKGAIMQPTYLPWLGYFAMIDDVDIFIFLDNVQLTKRSWQVRNRIKEHDGKELLLTIPVHTKGRDETKICDAKLLETDWYRKHLYSIRQSYSKAQYFGEVMPILEKIFEQKYEYLYEFNENLILAVCEYLQIKTSMLRSGDLKNISGKKDDLLVSICKEVGIDCYLSAKGSAAYIESETSGGAFSKAGILLEYQNYEHPKYRQLGKEFMPFMGIVDLLFNEGKESLAIIRSGVRKSYTSDNVL